MTSTGEQNQNNSTIQKYKELYENGIIAIEDVERFLEEGKITDIAFSYIVGFDF